MNATLGIDFGTTNCRAVVRFDNGTTAVVKDRNGEDAVAAIAAWHNGELIAGGDARALVGSPGVDSVRSIKRLIDHAGTTAEMDALVSRGALQLAPGAPSAPPTVVMGGYGFTPEQICSAILKQVKVNAETQFGVVIGEAVLTAPAGYSPGYRAVLESAAAAAGLRVTEFVAEPLGAVYGFRSTDSGHFCKTVLVYDFGGGSFKASIVKIAEDGALTVASTAADSHVSGEELDLAIANNWAARIDSSHGFQVHSNPLHFAKLLRHAERAKCELSSLNETRTTLEFGDGASFTVDLTRVEFESLAEPFVQHTLQTVYSVAELAAKHADAGLEHTDSVVLIGGCAVIPLVKRALMKWLGEGRVFGDVDPGSLSALGAVIEAAGPHQAPVGAIAPQPEQPAAPQAGSPSASLKPADELRMLDQQLETVTDLAELKPIFTRLDQIGRANPDDFEVQQLVGDIKEHVVVRGTKLRELLKTIRMKAIPAMQPTQVPAMPPPPAPPPMAAPPSPPAYSNYAPPSPAPPQPQGQPAPARSNLPMVLIGLAVLVAALVVAYILWGRK